MATKDYTGQIFGSLTVVRASPRTTAKRKIWICVCKCGRTVDVRSEGIAERKGCRSCTKAQLRHGHWENGKSSRTHEAWRSMKKRCSLPKNASFKSYGARGIDVCQRWMDSFENFLADMGDVPDGMSLDRYPDNDGPYSPENCRWATPKQQGRNKRNNYLLTVNGETRTLSEWAEISGLFATVISSRIYRGWSVHDAVTTPAQIYRRAG